jgi:hypothetical protein
MSAHSTIVHREWATRPDDERFTSLDDLLTAVTARKAVSRETTLRTSDLSAGYVTSDAPGDPGELTVKTPHGDALLSNYSAGQLFGFADVPAAYMRRIPAPLAAINTAWGLKQTDLSRTKLLTLGTLGDATTRVRAFTGENYGRVYDADLVRAVKSFVDATDGAWQVPAASYATSDPKRASTLYAGDRSTFVFLVNPSAGIDDGGSQVFPLVTVWNSEVGDRSLGLMTGWYRYVCDNRLIWGLRDDNVMRFRHTSGLPSRFQYEVLPFIRNWMNKGQRETAGQIETAKAKRIAPSAADAVKFLVGRKFAESVATAAVEAAEREEARGEGGDPLSVWGVLNGITSVARDLAHADARTDLEVAAGRLMALAR